jgi:3-oxoacyl-[acyl-carrier-protein] synthase II
MGAAMREAGISPSDVGYINAHATSTPQGDLAECRAIHKLMGEHTNSVAVSSTKGATGHLLGATGAAEAIFALQACNSGVIPPSLNCNHVDEENKLNIVRTKSVKWKAPPSGRRVALTNSFGFGGTNGTLCVANYVE